MPALWGALKKSVQCRADPRDVSVPTGDGDRAEDLNRIATKRGGGGGDDRCGCSRSIANLKDAVIHGSKRHTEKPPACSPRSIRSSELLNPITHEVVLDNSTCELKISTGFKDGCAVAGDCDDDISDFVGVLKPGTPGPGRFPVGRGYRRSGILGSPMRRTSSSLSRRSPGFGGLSARPRSSSRSSDSFGALICHKCGDQFVRWEAVEEHHLSKHAVTELVEGDSSRKIVEIICRASCGRSSSNGNDSQCSGIDRILKVHNMQKTIAQFEEHRELVKIKASKLPKKHPRCLADGNELLRFHGSTLECSLGTKASSSLCKSDTCRVCRILQHGFSTKKEFTNGIGVFTAATSSKALESIESPESGDSSIRKALIVCRVIAGRVHRPVENVQEMVGQSGFDSLAGKVGVHSNIEELYLLSPRALLPCFVVIYRP
ncbi:uncharacterized protein LOC127249596 [Andrographis paniculata]|uniref:uncharacterized protein LOC127249596 n=1 Tax=Andrographis paniculata TaxID=175694 RepID=UPI0021E7CDAC|nr:uncharacterized protein LOC127249596 [Andrographis paniculata]XP_051128450.1 uncharacterized protein LOC127249596 [Andrographis paniculata]XP_051128451.1 uncharacterized protein LOC127249596 [Andrographis paniculata]